MKAMTIIQDLEQKGLVTGCQDLILIKWITIRYMTMVFRTFYPTIPIIWFSGDQIILGTSPLIKEIDSGDCS